MIQRVCLIIFIFSLLLAGLVLAEDAKKQARIERIGTTPQMLMKTAPALMAADTCEARMDSGLYWRIDGWVWGNELYKAYIDPAASCPDPYPYTITHINMPMAFDAATPLVVSVDVEMVDDVSYPGCPIPGDPLHISSEYELAVPTGGGLFDIWIPLDTPVVVNGPFYAGFFISNDIDTAAHPAVITDDYPPDSCACFNVWDLDVGLVDLNVNQYYNFPGRLILYAAGITGGSGGGPEFDLVLLSPFENDTLYSKAHLWAYDSTNSNSLERVIFTYSYNGGAFTEITQVFDGDETLRDGVNGSTYQSGFSYDWDFSGLAEGDYTIRATGIDTLGYTMTVEKDVFLEPTPPVPHMTSPDNGTDFCGQQDFIFTCSDENTSFIEVRRKQANWEYSAGMSVFSQQAVGDNNSNVNDGNYAINGEFGDYYCGPVAAALSAKLWYDRGFTVLMRDGVTTLTLGQLTENLAAAFKTRENLGTYDGNFFNGLVNYFTAHGDTLTYDFLMKPDYFQLRAWVEEEQRAVMIGLSGDPALWLAVDGFSEWYQDDGSFRVRVSDPISGSMQTLAMRKVTGHSELFYDGSWHQLDIMVSIAPMEWPVSRSMVGADVMAYNGWSIVWTPTNLGEDSLYFFQSRAEDATFYVGYETMMMKYNCSESYMSGDYDNDGDRDISDLLVLIGYITASGPEPYGGAGRADANCDSYINITDVVYYMNFLFGYASDPCY